MGFLQTVSALSSVSGSSLTAAYYGLFGQDPKRWNPEKVRELLRTNFEAKWIFRWFLPHNIVRYWFTDFDRSDIMKAVFDDVLFEGKTLGEMPTGGPKILINATRLSDGQRFVFTDEAFRAMGSRLDTYPVSHAVMASGAFPGAFHDVTLQDYKEGAYEHLFDGGPVDNLGVETLLSVVGALYAQLPAGRQLACFFFLVDAYPRAREKAEQSRQERDTRKAFDFILDDNLADASDILLSRRRSDLLERVGFPEALVGQEAYREFAVIPGQPNGPRCSAWHLTFERLYALDEDRVGNIVNQIKTRYQLTGPAGYSAQQLQDSLYKAGRLLIRKDLASLRQACQWFRDRGFSGVCLREFAVGQ